MRWIEADDLMENVYNTCEVSDFEGGDYIFVDRLEELIKSLDSRAGKWLEQASPVGSVFECSKCGESVSESDSHIFSFCPFCGEPKELAND